MKTKRNQVSAMLEVLKTLSDKVSVARTAYAISKNKRVLEEEGKDIQESVRVYQDRFSSLMGLQEYESSRIALCVECSIKTEEGNPLIDKGGNYVIDPAKFDDFGSKLEALVTENREILDKRSELEKEFSEFLGEEVEMDLRTIKFDELPDGISASQIDTLGEIVVD